MSDSEISNPDDPQPGPSQPKKRKVAAPAEWKFPASKKKRNLGQAYTGMTGRKVEDRKIGPPCKDDCYSKVTRPVIESIHKDFWAIGDFVLQNAFIQKHCKKIAVKRRHVKLDPGATLRRQFSIDCTLSYGGTVHKVCREGFLNVLGITARRFRAAMANVTESGTPEAKKRGNYKRSSKLEEGKDRVREHIQSFPTVSSHYTRAKSPHMRYLDTDLNVALMCTMYNEWMQDNHPTETIMKECIYRQVFKEFRLSFKPPMTDTCSRCDELKVVITTSTRNKDERQKAAAEEALKDHQDLAARGHRLMKKMAQESADDVRVVCVDLQQTLPIPRLPTSVAYYKMKLWMYNLAVTNLKTGQSTCFVWYEVTGGRGSSEVATCLGQWVELEKAKGNFEKLVVFSDNCGGQNKNINIILSYMSVIHSGALKKVDHYYLVPGHSYMACDRAFGLIEKRIRAKNMIYSFED